MVQHTQPHCCLGTRKKHQQTFTIQQQYFYRISHYYYYRSTKGGKVCESLPLVLAKKNLWKTWFKLFPGMQLPLDMLLKISH